MEDSPNPPKTEEDVTSEIELNVENMSSPLIREKRHSEVDMRLLNLKW